MTALLVEINSHKLVFNGQFVSKIDNILILDPQYPR